MIVLDTNVISELMRPNPDETVLAWARSNARRSLFITAVSVAEVLRGLDRLPPGRRRRALEDKADWVFNGFDGQVLSFDNDAAFAYADVVDARVRAGRPIDDSDAQIAAVCLVRQVRLATRNTRDFELTGVDVIDPWVA